jgi:hypothetical protein
MRASENQSWSDVASLDWGKVNEDEEGRKAHNIAPIKSWLMSRDGPTRVDSSEFII